LLFGSICLQNLFPYFHFKTMVAFADEVCFL
jgi:hypothetical protein